MALVDWVVLLVCVLMASIRLSVIMQGNGDGWTWFAFVYFTLLAIVYAWLMARRRENRKS